MAACKRLRPAKVLRAPPIVLPATRVPPLPPTATTEGPKPSCNRWKPTHPPRCDGSSSEAHTRAVLENETACTEASLVVPSLPAADTLAAFIVAERAIASAFAGCFDPSRCSEHGRNPDKLLPVSRPCPEAAAFSAGTTGHAAAGHGTSRQVLMPSARKRPIASASAPRWARYASSRALVTPPSLISRCAARYQSRWPAPAALGSSSNRPRAVRCTVPG